MDVIDIVALRPNTIHHILALKSGKHDWHKVVQDPTHWYAIALVICCTMQQGEESSYKTVSKKYLTVNDYRVEVTFKRFSDDSIAISNAWVSRGNSEKTQGISL